MYLPSPASYPYHKLISLWADKYYELEDYFLQHTYMSRLDPKFLALLGDSVYRINVFNQELTNRLVSKRKNVGESEQRQLKRFCEFHNDLVVSKIKHFFFKELPNTTSNEIFFNIDRDIYELGRHLWVHGPSCPAEELKRDVGNYFFLLGLIYAFIYDSYEDQGVFLHFAYDAQKFWALNDLIQRELKELDNESHAHDLERNFRSRCNRLLPQVLQQYMQWDGISYPWQEMSLRQKYAAFVRHYGRGEIGSLEPCTWHVFDLLGKIDGMVQDSLEHESSSSHIDHQNELFQKAGSLLTELLSVFAKLYENYADGPDLRKVFDLEARFLDQYVFGAKKEPGESASSRLFSRPSLSFVCAQLDRLGHLGESAVDIKICTPANELELDSKLVPLLRALPEKEMKVEALLEHLGRTELLAVLQGYALQSEYEPYERKTPIVLGFYSSGVFLAHMLRLFHPSLKMKAQGRKEGQSAYTNNYVWMFKAFPYIAVHPLHDPESLAAPGGLLICDESVKTGFTYSILEAYARRFQLRPDRFVVQSIFEHDWYQDVETLNQPKIYSLFHVQDHKHTIIPTKSKLRMPDVQLVLNQSLESMQELDKKQANSHKQLDYTYLIADTHAALSTAYLMAQDIADRRKGRGIFLFSPSPEGRVLGLLTAFVLRLWDVPVTFDREKREECFKALVDLTRVTGFTADFQWELVTDSPRELRAKDSFDQVLSADQYPVIRRWVHRESEAPKGNQKEKAFGL
jgi:hypothetical protein